MEKKYLTEVVLLTKSYNIQDFKDWMRWHLEIIGFDHCHIFDNESTVDIKSVCDSYGDKVTYEKIVGWPNQYSLYNRYINNESPAWWVLPIDDDEFLYISDKYDNNVDKMILIMQKKYPSMKKLSIGWRNMFPEEYTKTRTKSLIENARAWSNEVCESMFKIWRQDNRWMKTFVKTTSKFYWGLSEDKSISNGGHNPIAINDKGCKSYFENGTLSTTPTVDYQMPKMRDDSNLCVCHYQFKSDDEWQMKCTKRISAANKSFNKNKPLVYKKLYEYQSNFNIFDNMIELFKK